jgi:integrase
MSRRYQDGCLYREKRKAGPDVWVFRFRDGQSNRKEQIGTVEQFPTKTLARKACESLRSAINRETRSPRTVAELVTHYKEKELPLKAYSTRAAYHCYIDNWILPQWDLHLLSAVKAVDVESWLGTIPRPNGTRSKIRNVMCAIFSHAMRNEWINRNPIKLVRQSAKRERLPDVLTAEEISALLAELQNPCRTAVLLAACTGLRVSELLALKWSDIYFDSGEIRPVRAIVDQHVGNLKTEASGRAIPIDAALAEALLDWRGRCPYNQNSDFLFGSPATNGGQPYWPDTMLHKVLKPAAVRAGITKRIGWHSFRRTLATLLQASGASVKATQDLLRHANSKITMDLYAQSIPAERREAQSRATGNFHSLFPTVP